MVYYMKTFTIVYDDLKDCYELYFYSNMQWKFSCSWDCVKGPNGKKDFIHFSILNEINKFCDLGYKYEPHTKEYFVSMGNEATW